MKCYLGNVMACLPQLWDQLVNRRSEDDKVSKSMWKAVETKARKIRMAKTKRRSEKRRIQKKGE